ncbi:MAG: glycosyltransferase 61 family protein [Paracoccus aminovorans]|nr:glycosyltransferase 61 family protein [Paracoccus aminovorans]
MIHEPLPDGGWSRQILNLRNALVCPAETHQDIPGVWCDGDVAEATTWRDGARVTPPLTEAPEPTATLAGRHLWAGIYFGHFGHFLVETLSRLWAARAEGVESVIFTPRHSRLRDFVSYQKELIELTLPDLPVRILREPTRVEELVVAGQGFGLGRISAGTEEFRSFIRDAFAPIEPGGLENVYVSRTRFGGKGGIINEQLVEDNLIAQGYTPVYPEKLSIREQLSIFKGARRIVGLDSSAFHMLGFVANPDQQACIILRRNHPAYHHIVEHLAGFTGRRPEVIDELVADWMPERQKIANHVTWGELDQPRLAQRLAELGLIADAGRWRDATPEEFDAAVQRAAERSQEPLVRRPTVRRPAKAPAAE